MIPATIDGLCNGGPWNTPQCSYDGGDCCEQTCKVPSIPEDDSDDIQKSISPIACDRSTFICIDPDYIDQPLTPETCEEEEEAPLSLLDENCANLSNLEDRMGNGVCDSCLNTEEYDFDGGDCCAETCQINRSFPDSCSDFCQCKVDPSDLVDTQPPEFTFEVPILPESTIDVSLMEQAPLVTAFDNSGAAPIIVYTETRIDGDCTNQYTLERSWTATDEAGNTVSYQTIIHVVDETPPVISPDTSTTTCLIPVAETIDAAPSSVFIPLSYISDNETTNVDLCIDDSNTYCNLSVDVFPSTCEALVMDETTDIAGNCTHNALDGGILLEFGQLFELKKKTKKSGKSSDDSLENEGERFLRKKKKKDEKKKDDECLIIDEKGKIKKKKCVLLTATYEVTITYEDSCGNRPNINSNVNDGDPTVTPTATFVVQSIDSDDEYCDRTLHFDASGIV